jgi:hypothetical protein
VLFVLDVSPIVFNQLRSHMAIISLLATKKKKVISLVRGAVGQQDQER